MKASINNRTKNNQQGIGIFMALILVMLITTVIASVATMSVFNIKRQSIINQINISNSYHRAAIEFAKEQLITDYSDNNFDSTADRWYYKMPAYPIFLNSSNSGGDTAIGYISGYINDAGSKFNLYDLHNPTKLQLESFTRLGQIIGLSNNKVNNIINLMKSNENIYSKTDVFLSSGLSENDIYILSPFVNLINGSVSININFVSPQVLAAYGNIPLAQASSLTNEIANNQIKNSESLNIFINNNLSKETNYDGIFSIISKYFQIITEVSIQNKTSTTVSNVIRVNRNTIITMNTRQEKFNDE